MVELYIFLYAPVDSCHRAQRTGRGLSLKLYPGLLQNMRFNLRQIWPQGIHTSQAVALSAAIAMAASTAVSGFV